MFEEARITSESQDATAAVSLVRVREGPRVGLVPMQKLQFGVSLRLLRACSAMAGAASRPVFTSRWTRAMLSSRYACTSPDGA